MTLSADTSTLTDTEILHLLRTLAPGIPPGLEQPPLPPDTLIPPPWPAHPPTAHPGRWIALAGGLGLLALWGIARGGGTPPVPSVAAYPTLEPGAVYAAGLPGTATASPMPPTLAPTFTATAFPSAPPTLPPAPPTDVPTLVPPTATPVRAAVPVYRPKPLTATPMLPPPAPTAPPSPVGGSGDWGNDWSGSIFNRSATIKAPTPTP